MECSVLSFFRAECKVSNTGSAQCWASSCKWIGNFFFTWNKIILWNEFFVFYFTVVSGLCYKNCPFNKEVTIINTFEYNFFLNTNELWASCYRNLNWYYALVKCYLLTDFNTTDIVYRNLKIALSFRVCRSTIYHYIIRLTKVDSPGLE